MTKAYQDFNGHVSARGALYVAGALLLCALLFLGSQRLSSRWAGQKSAEQVDADRDWALDLRVGLALAIIGAVPRLIAMRHSLWYDELWTVNFMEGGPIYAVTRQTGYNNHLLNSLLGSLLLGLRAALGGGRTHHDSSWLNLVRVPALLFGIASAPMLYMAAMSYLGRRVAAAGALLLALSPAAIDLSAQTRGYSSVIFFTICQAYFFGEALRTGAGRAWLNWLLAAVAGTFAHLYLIFPLIADLLLAAGLMVSRLLAGDHAGARRIYEPVAILYFAWALITTVCYIGVIGVVRSELRREAGMPPMARAHDIITPLIQTWGGVPIGWLRWAYYAAVLLMVIAGARYLWMRNIVLTCYLGLVLVLPPILVEAAHPHFVYMRFFSFALPAFLLWMTCGLAQGDLLLRRMMGSAPSGAGLALLTVGWVLLTLSGLRQVLWFPKQDYRHAAEQMAEAQRKGSAIAATGAGSEYLLSYGVRAYEPRSVSDLQSFLHEHGQVLILDTDLVVNSHVRMPLLTRYLNEYGGRPIVILPGRFSGWSYRWLDGDSDFKLYLLHSNSGTSGMTGQIAPSVR